MTRFPVFSSILATLPLAVLAWPLAETLKPASAKTADTAVTETGPIRRADLSIRSAHPFTSVTITIGDASWTITPEEPDQELHFPLTHSLPVLVSASWPAGTPETALLLELVPDGLEMRTQTLWGFREVTEEFIFTWDLN